jgi:hypothetical protein
LKKIKEKRRIEKKKWERKEKEKENKRRWTDGNERTQAGEAH